MILGAADAAEQPETAHFENGGRPAARRGAIVIWKERTGRQCPLRAEWGYGGCREGWGESSMSHFKQASNGKRMREALRALGVVGMSLSLAGGASAATAVPAADVPPWDTSRPQITLSEEEIADVSLATFYVFDKENVGTPQLGERFARGCGRCGGCGGGRGCAVRGCARGCAVGGGARGRCACGGCGCG